MITVDPNKIAFIFDVDGTLTKARQEITKDHKDILESWTSTRECFIATGSDFRKTKEQLGPEVLALFKFTFCCMGNEARNSKGTVVRKNNFMVPEELDYDLREILENSAYIPKTGRHFEVRTGMLNFSIVGRNADLEQRKHYNSWDVQHQERKKIADFINLKYPDLEASVGGSISIDVIQKGHDKGQVINILDNLGIKKLVFVGDRCMPGGNDWGIVRELRKSNIAFEWYNVSGPEETFELIKNNSVFFNH